MGNHQGYFLSKLQEKLLKETREQGMTEDILRKWEKNAHEKLQTEYRPTYLSMSVAVPANFSSYHKAAALILMHQDEFEAAAAIKELNHIKKHEAKAFVKFHSVGLTIKFIRENRDKYYFNDTTIAMLTLLIEKEHMTFQQALEEIEGMEPWLFDVVVDFHQYGLRCGDIRALQSSNETMNVVRNACLEYAMHKDVNWTGDVWTRMQFRHFVNNIFHGAVKSDATPQDAWLLVAGQVQQTTLANAFSGKKTWCAPRSVQADYLLAGFRQGIAPENIPVFTREYWKTYQSLRTLHHLSREQAIAEIRAVCSDISSEPMVWWSIGNRDEMISKRNDTKLQFLRDHYGDGIRAKDLAACPLVMNAVNECMEIEKMSAKRTVAFLNELEPLNAAYLQIYSSLGVSLKSISPVDFEHEPTMEELATFKVLVDVKHMGMKPDMAFTRIVNKDNQTLQALYDDAVMMTWMDDAVQIEENEAPRLKR